MKRFYILHIYILSLSFISVTKMLKILESFTLKLHVFGLANAHWTLG